MAQSPLARLRLAFAFLLSLLFVSPAMAAPGSFLGVTLAPGATASARGSAMQADGKVIVAGNHYTSGFPGTTTAEAARYNVDGSLDTTFGASGVASIGPVGSAGVYAVAIQADGKVVLGGGGGSFVRLDADGSPDTSFGNGNGIVAPSNSGALVLALAVQDDGTILAAGATSGGQPAILRLLPSGAIDTSFGSNGLVVVPMSSGGAFWGIAIQPDHKIVVPGYALTDGTVPTYSAVVARFNSDGSLDTAFGTGGVVTKDFGSQVVSAAAILLQPDGNIVWGGSMGSRTPRSFALMRLTSTGAFDTSFGNAGLVQSNFGDSDYLHALALLADGKIVAAGSIGILVGVAQYLPNGSLDPSYGTGGVVMQAMDSGTDSEWASGISVAADGTLELAVTASGPAMGLARFAGESATGTFATATVSGSSGPSPATVGQAVTLNATVTGSAGTPTGVVDFLVDGSGIAACMKVTVTGGSAQCTTGQIPPGSHTVTVLYSGDSTYGSATSSGFSQVVNKYDASVSLTSSANPSSPRMPVTFSTTVSGSAGTPTGSVAFNDGGIALTGCESVGLTNSGTASCTTYALAAGSHSITVAYSGDIHYNGATSAALTEVEQPIGPYDTNWALATNGGVASASSQYGPGYPIAAINDGERKGANWSNGGGWADGTVGAFPDWVEVDFNGPKDIDAVIVYTVQDNWQSPSLPTDTMTFTQYGVTDFTVQGWNGAQWVTLATVSGNRNVKRDVAISTFTTTKIRMNVTGAFNGLSRITEVEAWGVPGTSTQPVNVALSSNGGVAVASSQYGSGFPVSAINNGERAGANWTNGGGWADATVDSYPDWVEVDFSAPASLMSVVVYTVQDNWQSPIEPTDSTTFTQYGVTAFNVRGWDGSQWVTLGSVSGNNLVKRTVSFSAFVTSKIRVNVMGALASLSRITEVEAWGTSQAPTVTESNVALASTGTTVLASSGRGLNYPEAAIIDNERAGVNWTAGGGWADSTLNSFPDWVEIHFNGAQTLDKAVVYTVQDNWQNPVEPTDTTTFTQYGITDFMVQGWDGTQWVTLGTVSGNNLVKRTVTFAPFTTSVLRIYVTNALAGLSRITEVEAWGFPANPPTLTNWALPSNGGVATASSQYDANFPASAAIDGDTAGTNWSAGGGWADATVSAWPDWLQVNFSGFKSVREVTVYTLQDNWQNPAPPTNDMMFTQYGVTDFEVQAWDGSQWQTVGTVSNNRFVKRTVPIAAFYTDRIRVNVKGALNSLSRITEVQAWGN